jgi:hypothetical protein
VISPVEVPAMPPVLADWFVLVGLAAIWHSLTQQFSILPLLRPTKILVPSAVLLLFDVIDTLLDSIWRFLTMPVILTAPNTPVVPLLELIGIL